VIYMNLENLSNFERSGKIEKERFSLDSLAKKYKMSQDRYGSAVKLLKNNFNDESVYTSAYFELYGSFRSLCEIMLSLRGYRVKKGPGHHQTAISSLAITMDLDNAMRPAYLRLQKIGRKRDRMEYGGDYNVSQNEMETMLKDVEIILEGVDTEIKKKAGN
jgi:uncharacterized protein (UPF0332 family)